MEVAEVINTFLSICGGISITGGAVVMIWKLVNPAVNLKKRVETLEQKADNDYKDIQDIKKMQSAVCQALVDIMDHQIYGNHTAKMEQTKKDLIKLITEN